MIAINTMDEFNDAKATHAGTFMCLMPEELYNEVDAARQSYLSEYEKSEAHYENRLNQKFKTTEAMLVGTATHIRVLYGEQAFKDQVVARPDFNRRTKAGKEEAAEWDAQHEGKVILSEFDYSTAKRLAHNVLVHPEVNKMFANGYAEVSCFTTINGVFVKCRLDYWHPEKNVIVDLKTTRSVHGFLKSVQDYWYDVQAASYCEIVRRITGVPQDSVIVAIEKSPPFDVKRFIIDAEGMEMALNIYHQWLEKHRRCLANNHWSLSDPTIEVLKPRKWMRTT